MQYRTFAKQLKTMLQFKRELLDIAEVTDQWEPLIDDIDELIKTRDEALARFMTENPSFVEIFECDDDLAYR